MTNTKNPKTGVFVLMVLWIFYPCANLNSTLPVNCTAGVFVEGKNASVTCNFHEDINATRRHFSVIFVAADRTTTSARKMVLQCQWIFPQKPDCMVDSKYRFDYVVNENVTIGIPHATEEVAGNYSCQLVPPDRPTESCELQVNGRLNTTSNPYTSTTSPNTVATDVKDGYKVATFILVSIVVLMLLLILFLLREKLFKQTLMRCHCCHNYQENQQRRTYGPTQGGSPMTTRTL